MVGIKLILKIKALVKRLELGFSNLEIQHLQLGKILKINKYANDISTIRKLINDIKNELTSQLEKHLDQFNIKSEQQIEQESEQETAQLDDEGCGEEYEC